MTDTRPIDGDQTGVMAVSRRGALGAVSLGIAASAVPAAAAAVSSTGPALHEFSGLFPVGAGRDVDGLFVVPAGKRDLDVVVIAARADAPAGEVKEAARRLARQGSYAVAPRLPEGDAARLAALDALTPLLAHMAHTSGKVRIVSI